MSYQLIDMTKGLRSGQFAYFRQMLFPFAGVTAEVDITDFAARRQGRPFFLSFLYAVVRAANAVPQLRRRIRDSQLTLESLQVGTRSRTDVVLCYMENRVDRKLLDQLREKLEAMDVGSIWLERALAGK